AVAFSATGKRLAAVHRDEAVQVWDVTSGDRIAAFPSPGRLTYELRGTGMTFLPDGETLVLAAPDERPVRVLRPATGQESPGFLSGTEGHALTLSADGRSLVLGTEGALAEVWETASGRRRARLPEKTGQLAAAISADGWLVATSGPDDTVYV